MIKKFYLIVLATVLAFSFLQSQSRYNLPYQRLGTGAYTIFEIQNGKLYAGGFNSSGQIGNGTVSVPVNGSPASIFGFVQIGSDEDWTSVNGSTSRSYGIKNDGSLWAWGNNQLNYLGVGNTPSVFVPSPTKMAGQNWKQVSANDTHACALKSDGTLWSWGRNNEGQRGLGVFTNGISTPLQIGTDTDWVQVSTGARFTLARKADGTIWSWGQNAESQLGRNTGGSPSATPTQIGSASDWVHIEAGFATALALKADGTLWSWGENNYSQLGLGSAINAPPVSSPTQVGTDDDWVSVAIGFRQTFALKANGSLWGWGSNNNNTVSPNGGSAVTFSTPTRIGSRNDWVNIEVGSGWVAGLTADGYTHAWGNNFLGSYGDGTSTSATAAAPRQLRQHTCWLDVASQGFNSIALRSDGKVFTCGIGLALGLGNILSASAPTFTQVPLPGTAIAIEQGNGYTFVILADGRLVAFGENSHGQLGDGTFASKGTPTIISPASVWKHMTAGYRHSLAVKADGTLWSWGENRRGVLGQGIGTTGANSTIIYNQPTQIGAQTNWVDVRASASNSMARKADGTIWNWGSNLFGTIGNSSAANAFDIPQQMGTNRNWIDSRVESYGMGLRADGSLWAWGSGNVGAMGNGTRQSVSSPQRVATLLQPVVRISAGKSLHAVLADGSVQGWGGNGGAIGNGATTFFETTPSNIVFGENYPYLEGGNYGTQAITLTRDTLCYTGSNTNNVAGKPNLQLTDIFQCDPVLLNSNQNTISPEVVQLPGWKLHQSEEGYTLHYHLENDQPIFFQLIDLKGRNLWEFPAYQHGQKLIPTRDLVPGIYILKGGRWPAKRIAIRR